ncbi:hypothetical protein Ahy_B06g080382 isoform A [Arachis hypogaea]|uniref:Uncharacterized protein n=1 Tax=Arachis hypogaea TaxID=3818 RepID=A0A444YHT9_ARAHY|nr:hypothetical protein Ahy_B06g080382 isoform A [Arachis hypogaea]
MMSLVASSASSTDKFTRLLDRSKESPKAVKQLTRLFPNWVCQYNFLSLKYGLNILQGTEGENKKSKKLLKNTLKELDMLPPQRPELFSKGQLAKVETSFTILTCIIAFHCNYFGVALQGNIALWPPDTRKTMLAKAIATEAGANFINILMSSIISILFNVDNVGFHNVKSSMEWPCEGFKGLCSYWHAL